MTKQVKFKNKSGKEFEILEITMENAKFPYRLGKRKARLIVENFEAIKEFAESK